MWASVQKAHTGKRNIHSWQGGCESGPSSQGSTTKDCTVLGPWHWGVTDPVRGPWPCEGSLTLYWGPWHCAGSWHGSQPTACVFWHCWIPWLLKLACRWFGRAWPALLLHLTRCPQVCSPHLAAAAQNQDSAGPSLDWAGDVYPAVGAVSVTPLAGNR